MAHRLYLLRHGSTGADGRFIGTTDLPLSEEGQGQVKAVRSVVESAAIDAILCSPMTRCVQTLDLLNVSVASETIEELREIDFGLWENLDFASVNSQYPDDVSDWMKSPETFSFPRGESLPGFLKRLRKVKKIIEDHPDDKVLVVCHGGVIRYMICLFLHLPLSSAMLFTVFPGCCTRIDIHDQGGVLTGFNLSGEVNGQN
ncbi:histidine phosphatase family protein [Desulfopila sp. IMCC35008]|uniref:histidine phosphatase family protein n=1 Tax=Desulfopila sp. IMCC35008 TaxID=2653858 RepID=UPI0013D10A43|nr:histidine phosphatase family protein [Desulfopila sp. IMCC35008]